MQPAEIYRKNAAAQRAAADATNLANRREMHERSAMAWDAMAEAVEDTTAKAAVNAAAKQSVRDIITAASPA
jgi:hypothetical protein